MTFVVFASQRHCWNGLSWLDIKVLTPLRMTLFTHYPPSRCLQYIPLVLSPSRKAPSLGFTTVDWFSMGPSIMSDNRKQVSVPCHCCRSFGFVCICRKQWKVQIRTWMGRWSSRNLWTICKIMRKTWNLFSRAWTEGELVCNYPQISCYSLGTCLSYPTNQMFCSDLGVILIGDELSSSIVIQVKYILRRSWSHSRTLVFTYHDSMPRRSYKGKILGWSSIPLRFWSILSVYLLLPVWFIFSRVYGFVFNFVNSMDKNGTMTIDWNEWSNDPLLQPKENNIPEITLYWKHSTVRRVGGRGLWTSYPPSREQFYFTLIWVHSVSTDKIPESSKLWMGMLILLHRLTLWMDVRHQLSLISV